LINILQNYKKAKQKSSTLPTQSANNKISEKQCNTSTSQENDYTQLLIKFPKILIYTHNILGCFQE
jgi:hypothetical protein